MAPRKGKQPADSGPWMEELRQHRQVKDQDLGVGDVRDEALPPAAERSRARVRVPGGRAVVSSPDCLVHCLDAQERQVTHARPLNRLEHWLRTRDQRAEAGGGRCALHRIGGADPQCGLPAPALTRHQGVLDDHREVGAWDKHEDAGERQELTVRRPARHVNQAYVLAEAQGAHARQRTSWNHLQTCPRRRVISRSSSSRATGASSLQRSTGPAAPAQLRKGPRGGGRDTDKIVAHVAGADHLWEIEDKSEPR